MNVATRDRGTRPALALFFIVTLAGCGTSAPGIDAETPLDSAADASTRADSHTSDARDATSENARDAVGDLVVPPDADARARDATTPPADASTPRDATAPSDTGTPRDATAPSDTGTNPSTPVLPSPGCGVNFTAGDLVRRTVMNGSRTYWIHVPAGSVGAAPEKLVFVWHGCNMSVNNIRSGLTVEAAATAAHDNALFVYPQITNASDSGASGETCFDWTRDAPYFDAVLADVEASFCVDEHRVFTAGYSSGAIMSEMLGCERSSVLRAIGAAEGGFDRRQTACSGGVDAYVIHSPLDEQIGWNTGAPVTSTNPYAWTDGRGYVPFALLYANDGCSNPALDPNDATIGQIDYTCGGLDAFGHTYRLKRWLHNYQVPASWGSNIPHHWFPPEAPAAIWDFFASAP